MKSLSSVYSSVRPSLSFLKIGSLVFSDIAHDDNLPWYLVTGEPRFLKKRFWRPKLRAHGSKSGQKLVFPQFSQVCFISFSLILHEIIACHIIWHLVEEKSTKKNEIKFGSKRAKIRSKIRFFAIFSSLFH